MQRRSVLAVCGAGLAWLAGCTGGGAAGDPTESPGSTTTVSDAEQSFRAAVESATNERVDVSSEGVTWTLEYRAEVTTGDRFDAQQADIAEAFVSARPDNTTLAATAIHECTTVEWTVPADLAREYDRGRIGTDELLSRVQNGTTRENNC